jgi:hypothetical protein
MAKSKQSADPKPAEDAIPATARRADKLVPLQRRLGKLRKEEAKRQRQLKAVQARAARTSEELTQLLQSVTAWLEHPEPPKDVAPESKNGARQTVTAGH